jgi:sugar phosphate isomerase/epimerase
MNPIIRSLEKFDGVVSLEVFAYEHLDASLKFLEKCWNNQQKMVMYS